MILNKKSSISLSMEAIIIIIIAITMLGLGLTFIRTLFGKGTESLGTVFDSALLENPATALEPLTVPAKIELNVGEEKRIDIGFYCDSSTDCADVAPSISKCSDFTGVCIPDFSNAVSAISSCKDPDDKDLKLISPITTVPAHKSIGFKAVIKWDADSANIPISTICTLDISDGTAGSTPYKSTQIYIKVS